MERTPAPEVCRVSSSSTKTDPLDSKLDELRRRRPRPVLLMSSLAVFAGLLALAASKGLFSFGAAFESNRQARFTRFLKGLVPPELRTAERGPGDFMRWLAEHATWDALRVVGTTAAIAATAIGLAVAGAGLLAPLAARTLAERDPHLESGPAPLRGFAAGCVRWAFVLLRALPEFVLAFLAVALFGRGAWPAVLALAIHNTGILGRLQAETIENLPSGPGRALRLGGASRAQLALVAQPRTRTRFASFAFYRFETCVREATVLGLLGIASLGYRIELERTRRYYDEMLWWIALGALLVLAAEFFSRRVRSALR